MKHFVLSTFVMALTAVCLAHDTHSPSGPSVALQAGEEPDIEISEADLVALFDRQQSNIYQKLSSKERAFVLEVANKAIKQHMKIVPMKLVSHQPED